MKGQVKTQAGRKKIIKAEISNSERKLKKISEAKSWLIGKINKTAKLLAQLIQKKKEKTQITNIRNEKRNITTDHIDIKSILLGITLCYQFDKWNEMEKSTEDKKHQSLYKKKQIT